MFSVTCGLSFGRRCLESLFLFSLKDDGLILVDPAFVLCFTLNGVISMYCLNDGTDRSHVEEDLLAFELTVEAGRLVSDCNSHVLLRCNRCLISGYLEDISLV